MSEQRQPLRTLSPQLVITAPGTPFRLSSTDLFVRSVTIESAEGNTGKIYIADSEAKASTLNRHVLYEEGAAFIISASPWGALNAQVNLREIWIDGSVTSDRLVVSYIEILQDFST
jgi:hypothetical protein